MLKDEQFKQIVYLKEKVESLNLQINNKGKSLFNRGTQVKKESRENNTQTELNALSSFGHVSEGDGFMQEQTDNSTNMNSTQPILNKPRIQSANRSNMSIGMTFYKENSHSGMMTNKGPSHPDL